MGLEQEVAKVHRPVDADRDPLSRARGRERGRERRRPAAREPGEPMQGNPVDAGGSGVERLPGGLGGVLDPEAGGTVRRARGGGVSRSRDRVRGAAGGTRREGGEHDRHDEDGDSERRMSRQGWGSATGSSHLFASSTLANQSSRVGTRERSGIATGVLEPEGSRAACTIARHEACVTRSACARSGDVSGRSRSGASAPCRR
jgi:hypothetical protein